MTKHEREVLSRFASHDWPKSRHEVFGTQAFPANVETGAAIDALRAAGLLEAIPTSEQADRYGGTLFRVTSLGKRELGLATTPVPARAAKGRVSNGKRRATA